MEYPNIRAIANTSHGGFPKLESGKAFKEPPAASLQAAARDMLLVMGEVEATLAAYLVRHDAEELRLAKVAIGTVIEKAYGLR